MVPTRGHAFKLYMPESRVNRQHFLLFVLSTYQSWNSLPDDVVAADRLSGLTENAGPENAGPNCRG